MEIETGSWHDALEYAAGTDVGMRRGNNQDARVVALAGSRGHWERRGHLLAVADGMGAHAAGELASQMAVENVPHTYNKLVRLPPSVALRRAVLESNRLIHLKGETSVGFHGMGTTCSALLLLSDGAIVAHVGDSRVYRLRGESLDQLTFDHSLVWELAEAGRVPEEDVPQFVPKNVITRSLGPHVTVDVDLEGPHPVQAGDTYLLCSDGLTGPVKDIEIGTILACLPPKEAVQALIDIANLRGGPDNITAIVARVDRVEARPRAADSDEMEVIDRVHGSVHPAVFGIGVILLVLALTLAALGKWMAAIAAGGGLVIAAIIALLQRMERPQEASTVGGPLGRGPYRTHDCSASKTTVGALAEITHELREVAKTPGWEIDSSGFESHCEKAQSASDQGDHTAAVSQYCTAIRHMMDQVRDQRTGAEDSNIF